MKNRKKAFTLTELLVVVIVIGVLSAAVLPKFSKIIETRKTTEAEELMASIRTEQEKRCALDKPYLTELSAMTDIVKKSETKNYQLTLQEKGIIASSKGNYNYNLQMPSYADGRVCCDGDDCGNLNKNYPSCTELKGKGDYQPSPDSCAGKVIPPADPTPCEIDPTGCACNPNQAKCCAEGEVWQNGSCVVVEPETPPTPGCSNDHTEGETAPGWELSGGNLSTGLGSFTNSDCSFGECAVTRYYWHCGADTDYQWEKKKETNCEPKPSETKPCEDKGNRKASGNQTATYTCGSNGWTLSGWDSSACRYSCDPATKPQEDPKKTMKCNYCGKAVIQYECDEKTGNWKEIGGPCNKTQQECGYWCGTAQAQCKPGAHDYKSGERCAPGKGHPDAYVTRYGNECTLSNGYVCPMKNDGSGFAADLGGGTSNSKRACECPSTWWSGRYCDERCRWMEERCAPSGGGGGGGRRGGCSTHLSVRGYYKDALGNYHEIWGYVTTCE